MNTKTVRITAALALSAAFAALPSRAERVDYDAISGFDLTDLTESIGGTASDSGTHNNNAFPASNLFDNQTGRASRYLVEPAKYTSVWAQYEFSESTEVTAYSFTTPNKTDGYDVSAERAPKAWTFAGSNDGETWTTLDSESDQTGWSNTGETRYYMLDQSGDYRYYRVTFTAVVNNTFLQLQEMEMYGFVMGSPVIDASASSMTYAATEKKVTGSVALKGVSVAASVTVQVQLDGEQVGDAVTVGDLAAGGSGTFAIDLANYTLQAGTVYSVVAIAQGTSGDAVTLVLGTFYSGGKDGENIWIAGADSDGLASTGSNWSQGRPPVEGEKVILSGDFSSVDLWYDAAATNDASVLNTAVSTKLGAWQQEASYTGLVRMPTSYAGAFTCLTVTGDVSIAGGRVTHLSNGDAQTFRLRLDVGGNLTIGSGASIDAAQRGYGFGKSPADGAPGVHAGGRHGLSDKVYGDVKEPIAIGAGSVAQDGNGAGGGAVYLTVGGSVTIDGELRANAYLGSDGATVNSGAGGSIFIRAASVGGEGIMRASAARNGYCPQPASGGRIGIVLTDSEELGMALSRIAFYGSIGSNGGGGGGTLCVRTPTKPNGTLYVQNQQIATTIGDGRHTLPHPDTTCVIPAGETWTVDALVFRQSGVLSIPSGAKLVLANGYQSVSGENSTANVYPSGGILMRGGVIDAGAESPYVIQNNWTLSADGAETPVTLDGNVVVKAGASLGSLRLFSSTADTRYTSIVVNGDLTVEEDGLLASVGCGYSHVAQYAFGNGGTAVTGLLDGALAHGGQVGYYGSTNIVAYGSICHPMLPGPVGFYQGSGPLLFQGGGALKVSVSGALTLNGKALSRGAFSSTNKTPGGGGSLEIVAATLGGTGSIDASGLAGAENDSYKESFAPKSEGHNMCSPGGRVAVYLTGEGATFSDHWLENIRATGATTALSKAMTNHYSSAGTVYLETAANGEGGGTVLVRDIDAERNAWSYTPFPSVAHGGESETFKKANLALAGRARVALSRDTVAVSTLDIEANSLVELGGRTLRVKRLVVNGTRVASGTYAAADLAAAFTDRLGTGSVVVTGAGSFRLVVR